MHQVCASTTAASLLFTGWGARALAELLHANRLDWCGLWLMLAVLLQVCCCACVGGGFVSRPSGCTADASGRPTADWRAEIHAQPRWRGHVVAARLRYVHSSLSCFAVRPALKGRAPKHAGVQSPMRCRWGSLVVGVARFGSRVQFKNAAAPLYSPSRAPHGMRG